MWNGAKAPNPVDNLIDAANDKVTQMMDQFKAKTFSTFLRSGSLHYIHMEAYDELAKKNGGQSFSYPQHDTY